jgi:hypothetical protein
METYTETTKRLKPWIDLVTANLENWKDPIECEVTASDSELSLIEEAIAFYTGSETFFTKNKNGTIKVMADGYYLTIGA